VGGTERGRTLDEGGRWKDRNGVRTATSPPSREFGGFLGLHRVEYPESPDRLGVVGAVRRLPEVSGCDSLRSSSLRSCGPYVVSPSERGGRFHRPPITRRRSRHACRPFQSRPQHRNHTHPSRFTRSHCSLAHQLREQALPSIRSLHSRIPRVPWSRPDSRDSTRQSGVSSYINTSTGPIQGVENGPAIGKWHTNERIRREQQRAVENQTTTVSAAAVVSREIRNGVPSGSSYCSNSVSRVIPARPAPRWRRSGSDRSPGRRWLRCRPK